MSFYSSFFDMSLSCHISPFRRSLNAEEEDTPVPELARARLQAALSLAKELLATIYSSNRDDQLLPDSSSSRTTHLFVSARQVIGQVREIVQRLEIAEATQEASAKSILATKKQLYMILFFLHLLYCSGFFYFFFGFRERLVMDFLALKHAISLYLLPLSSGVEFFDFFFRKGGRCRSSSLHALSRRITGNCIRSRRDSGP